MTRKKDNFIETLEPYLPLAVGGCVVFALLNNQSEGATAKAINEPESIGLGDELSWWQNLIGTGNDGSNPDSAYKWQQQFQRL